MTKDAEQILQKLLSLDMFKSAYNLKFISKQHEDLNYDDVCDAVKVLNQLSLSDDEKSKNTFITIAALLWEHANSKFIGLRDILIILLARIGYSPSSIILDSSFNEDNRFASLGSLISQWETVINQHRYEIQVNEKPFLLTDFQYNMWNAIKTQRLTGISAPTSAGKSFVLVLESARLVIENKYDVIYIVPTLSLVNQVTEDYINIFKQLNWTKYEILNSYNNDLINDKIPQIFVLTQERAIAAFSISETPFEYNSMLIIDEIQNIERVAHDSSEMRSKILLDAIFEFRFLESIYKIVISGPRINEIDILGEKLFGENGNKSISTDISPVLNITYGIEQAEETYYFKQYCSILEKPLSIRITNSTMISGHGKKLYNKPFIDYLVSFITSLGSDVQNIIFSPTSKQARETAIAIQSSLKDNHENTKLRDLSDYLKSTVHDNYSLAATVISGIAYHHGRLPAHARKVIEKAMSGKLLTNIACTTTLMQGINMPAQNIIIRNPHLYIRKLKGSAELSSYEMANLRGRAGRLLKDFIGRTYVLDENEFLSYSDEYFQETLFENTYKDLDSSYKKTFDDYGQEIRTALDEETTSNLLSESYRHIVIHIRQSILRHGDGAKQRLRSIGLGLSDDEFNDIKLSLKDLEVPNEICVKNRYWDPLVLNALYLDKDLPLVPTSVADRGIKTKLYNLLKYLRESDNYNSFFNEHIPDGYRNGMMLSILCDNATKWAKEKPLKEILSGTYHENPDNIEDTISMLQKTIAFDLPVLLRPVYDVQIKEATFLTFIEAGAFNPITRKLIEIGVPRETAIFLFQTFLADLDYTSANLYEYIKLEIRNKQSQIPYWVKVQISFLL